MSRACPMFAIGLFLSAAACGNDPLATLDPELETFTPTYERDVRPVLARHCIACHTSSGVAIGGVQLDTYETAWGNQKRSACTAIVAALKERYGDHLRPIKRDTDDPLVPAKPCGDWQVYSMPTGAQPRLTMAEQLILVRWVVTGAAR